MKIGSGLLLAALTFLLLARTLSFAQEETTLPTISHDAYAEVLDILFPRGELNTLGIGFGFATVLQYRPSFEAESQIVIVGLDGRVRVIEYKSLDGNIYYRLGELLRRTGQDDPAQLAKLIRVSRREFTVPLMQAQRWRRNLIDSISLALQTKKFEFAPKTIDVTLDGTAYELWDTSVSGEVHYSPSGEQVSRRTYPGKRLFTSWMKTIQREVSKH